MLEVEAALLLLLQRRSRAADDSLAALRMLEHGYALDIVAGRVAAARASIDTMRLEAPDLPIIRPSPDVEYETRRAQRAARGWFNGYREAAEQAAAEGADNIARAAAQANAWRVELAATTEVAEAFNVARERALAETLWQHPSLAYELFKVWDATLDKRTCEVCGGAHGTIVRIGEPFPDGVPGQVHPRCRCQEHLLTRYERAMIS